MENKTFSEVFSSNMKDMGLPVPSSIFGTVGTTLTTVGALAGAITKVGVNATVSEIFLTLPLGAGTAATAVAVSEIVAVIGACSASFYLGACIGSVLVAAYETLDCSELTKVVSWFGDLKNKLGENASDFLKSVFASNAQLSPIRKSQILAQMATGAPSVVFA